MLDTLMVLWTKSLGTRFVRFLLIVSLLLAGVCLLFFGASVSGIWSPSTAFTPPAPVISNASAKISLAPTPTQSAYSIPDILQNPTPVVSLHKKHAIAPAPVATPATQATGSTSAPLPSPRRIYHRPVHTPTSRPAPVPTVVPTASDPSFWFDNASQFPHARNNTTVAAQRLKYLFWPGMLAASVMLLCCSALLLLVLKRRKVRAITPAKPL